LLTRADLAKYPFLSEATDYLRTLGVSVNDISSAGYEPILERAESRLQEALAKGIVSGDFLDEKVEILSFPVSNLLLVLTGEDRARRRYALAESKRAYELLRHEPPEKLEHIASTSFGWKIRRTNYQQDNRVFDFQVGIVDYLSNSVKLKEPRWKLVNRILDAGYVYTTRDEAARLLEEEIRERIFTRTGPKSSLPDIPDSLEVVLESVKTAITKYLGAPAQYELPRTAMPKAMPPCIQHLIKELDVGKNVQHMGRFTLASFLVNIGSEEEEIVRLFKPASDFSERMTRYQVEHIAGKRGGGTKYTCPMCTTLKTHGVCYKPDELCSTIRNPLSYYKRKARNLSKEIKGA